MVIDYIMENEKEKEIQYAVWLFDNENREYVITNPKTPAPWANYLGSPDMVL